MTTLSNPEHPHLVVEIDGESTTVVVHVRPEDRARLKALAAQRGETMTQTFTKAITVLEIPSVPLHEALELLAWAHGQNKEKQNENTSK